jgi:hypothetical protein
MAGDEDSVERRRRRRICRPGQRDRALEAGLRPLAEGFTDAATTRVPAGVVAIAGGGIDAEIVDGQCDVDGCDVLLEVRPALGARDGDHVVALARDPRQGQLTGGDALFGGKLAQGGDDGEVVVQVVIGEPRQSAAHVVGRQLGGGGDRSGQEAATERREGHDADTQLAAGRQHLGLDLPGPQRPLALQRGHRVHGVRAADRRRRCLGDAEVANLARGNEFGQGAPGLLDGNVRIHTMLVVEVDMVDTEPGQRLVAALFDVTGVAARLHDTALAPHDAELGREHHLVAAIGDSTPDQSLVGFGPIDVGGVEHRHAQVERAVDGGDGLVVVVAHAVGLAHTHAAKPLCTHGQLAEFPGRDHAGISSFSTPDAVLRQVR